jgi:hypothetical protein
MKEKTILNKIKEVLGLEVKLEQMKLDNGTVIEADVFEPNAEVFVVSAEDRIPIPIGEYILEDGRVMIIAEDGILSEIKDAVSEEAPASEVAPADVPVAAEEVKTLPKKVIDSISKETFFSEIEKLNAKIDALSLSKVEVEEVKKEEKVENAVEVELSVEPIKHSPEAFVEKKKQNLYSQNRTYGAKELVFKKLFNN